MNNSVKSALSLCWDGVSLKAMKKTLCKDKDNSGIPTQYRQMYFLPIPINEADYELLLTIPGVGPSIARKIVDFRQLSGNINAIEDLLKIKGVGKRKLLTLKEYVIVE